MTLGETLISIWRQNLAEGRSPIELKGKTYSVFREQGRQESTDLQTTAVMSSA
jgi:hypothetical protein